LVEQRPEEPCVPSSSLGGATTQDQLMPSYNRERMGAKDKTVAIIGLGYVGLPLAVQAAAKGYQVIGIDINNDLNNMVNKRQSPFANDNRFKQDFAKIPARLLKASSSFADVAKAEFIIICVPTPTEDNVPDLSYVKNTASNIARYLVKDQTVILESTVSPGITRDEILPILEAGSGLVAGQDFCLAHCPERIDPGNPKFHVGNLNRVVGGISQKCTKKARQFYSSIIDGKIIELDSPEEAEFVKSWENSHRNVMIALANEAAVICDSLGMNIDNILNGLQSKVDQFGLKLARPGIGPGGHCIPEDIHYVIKKARQTGIDTTFLDAATDLNDKMPRYAVGQMQKMIKDNGEDIKDINVALLGLAYKENIEDSRRSPAINVAHILVQKVKGLKLHDPYVKLKNIRAKGAEKEADLTKALTGTDAVFIATAHDEYKKLKAADFKRYGIRYVFDGRNCLNKSALINSGIIYKGIGQ
jgi:UDP-N-acetyl-D-glucosamine dehydrogenase